MRTTITAILLLLAFSSHSQAAKFYKWVDDNGVTHYSAQPPRDKPSETVNVTTGESLSAKKTDVEEADGSTENPGQVQPETPPKITVLPTASTKDPVSCEESRKTQKMLQGSGQLRIKDEETGEHRVASKAEMESWLEMSAEDVSRFCP